MTTLLHDAFVVVVTLVAMLATATAIYSIGTIIRRSWEGRP